VLKLVPFVYGELSDAGHEAAWTEVDDVLQSRVLKIIAEHPFRHLALIIPFLWRGAVFAFPVLAVMLGYSLWRRRYDLCTFALPTFGMVMFYALLTHFISRYGEPAAPVAVVSLIIFGKAVWDEVRERRVPAAMKAQGATG